ncbi:hypothetical protein NTH44_003689, partial [Vibrio metoecus]
MAEVKMKNIELFNLAVSEILGSCYEQFPNRVSFSANDIAINVCDFYPESELEDTFFPLVTLCKSTVKWLDDAGYLWIKHEVGMDYHGVTLTPKAFELLNIMPTSLKSKESIGEILLNKAKQAGKITALEAVKLLLSEGVRRIPNA